MLQRIEPGKPNPEAKHALDLTFQPLLAAALTGQPLEPAMQLIMRSFGFDSFLYAVTTVAQPQRDSRFYSWHTLPREWAALYDQNAYVEVDPRVTETLGRTTPFVWDAATLKVSKKVRKFLDHAAQYGIRSGVAISFNDPMHGRFGVAFNSSISPVDEQRREMIEAQLGTLMLFGARFHDFFMVNVISRGLPPIHQGSRLSPRELQCLQLAAHGMTSADIGIKLGIVERTANFHFSNILSKLGALNRHEAIAKGMRLGLIKMEL
jgi:DNA-binding CsgD family transcriptional regulator